MSLVMLMSDAKRTGYMSGNYTQAVPYSKCIECGTGTRSHVLKPPVYEAYLQETRPRRIGETDDDVPAVEKHELVEDAEVVCHKCWLKLRDKTFNQLKRDSGKWIEEPLPNSQRIKSFLTRWEEFEFGSNMPDGDMNKIITELKDSIRRSARGE